MDSWNELIPPEKSTAIGGLVRISFSMRTSGFSRGRLLIRHSVLEQINGEPYRYNIAAGKGENKHLLRLKQDKGGAFTAVEVRNHLPNKPKSADPVWRIMLPVNEDWAILNMKPVEVAHEHCNPRSLIITLPAVVWNVPTTLPATRKPGIAI